MAKIRFRNYPQGQLRESRTGPVATSRPTPFHFSFLCPGCTWLEKTTRLFPTPHPHPQLLAFLVKWVWSVMWICLFLFLKLKMKEFLFDWSTQIMENKRMSVSRVPVLLLSDMRSSTLLSNCSLMFWKVKWRTHSWQNIIFLFTWSYAF